VVRAGELDETCAGNVRGDEAPLLEVGIAVRRPVHDDGRNTNRRQDVPHVDIGIHLQQGESRAWAGAPAVVAGELGQACRIKAWCHIFPAEPGRPVALGLGECLEPLLPGRCPRIVRAPDPLGGGAKGAERDRALRIGRREDHAHVAAFGGAENSRLLTVNGVHDHPDIVHALLERWQLVGRHRIRHARATLVEQDQTRERRQTLEAGRELRQLPCELDM
jgi:hypothetical protein